MSDWIEWDGGECPVPPETLVRVRFAGVSRVDAARLSPSVAGSLRWEHDGSGGDIFEFQIVEAAAEAAAPAPADGGPAFPVSDIGHHGHYGMTLRDWFAGHVAAGMAAFSGTAGISYGPAEIAGRSYEIADALVAARAAAPEARHE